MDCKTSDKKKKHKTCKWNQVKYQVQITIAVVSLHLYLFFKTLCLVVTSLPTTISIPSSNPAASTHGKLAALIGIFNRNCSNYATTITSEASGNASGYSSGSQQSQTDVNKFQGPIPPMQPAAFASVSGPNAGATARGFAGKVGVEPNVPIHNPGIPTDELAHITDGRVLKLEERVQLIEAKLREHGLL